MGVKSKARRDADKIRRVKPRKAGDSKNPNNLVMTMNIPSWLLREASGLDSVHEVLEYWKQVEFEPVITEEGILYKIYKVVTSETAGW